MIGGNHNKRRKARNVALWVVLSVAMVGILGFVSGNRRATLLSGIHIHVERPEGVYFLNKKDVREFLANRFGKIKGTPIARLPLDQMEHVLAGIPEAHSAEVYLTIEGTLRVRITQREPVVRLIDRQGEGCYIDSQGRLMPLSSRFTAHVPVITGDYLLSWLEKDALSGPDTAHKAVVKGIYGLARTLRAEPFWQAQVQQIKVDGEGNGILIPRVGEHRILLGEVTDVDPKLRKLMAFYRNSLGNTDWKKYDTIDLKFKEQIVCKKE